MGSSSAEDLYEDRQAEERAKKVQETLTRSLSFGTVPSSEVHEALVKFGLDREVLLIAVSSDTASVTPGIILLYPSPELLKECQESRLSLLAISSELILDMALETIQNIGILLDKATSSSDQTQPEVQSSSVKEN